MSRQTFYAFIMCFLSRQKSAMDSYHILMGIIELHPELKCYTELWSLNQQGQVRAAPTKGINWVLKDIELVSR